MGANMGPIWGQQDPGGPHIGPMNFAIWVTICKTAMYLENNTYELQISTFAEITKTVAFIWSILYKPPEKILSWHHMDINNRM